MNTNVLELPIQNPRITTYGNVATKLALLSDNHLLELLEEATSLGTSIGGQTALWWRTILKKLLHL